MRHHRRQAGHAALLRQPATGDGEFARDLEGKWYKVLGYNPITHHPCQTNEFSLTARGADQRHPLILPDGSRRQNNFLESMDDSRGLEGKASMTVEGKMFGLTFHEQWYVLGKGNDFRVVSYIGDTQQGPYDGAFVFTKEKDTLLKDAKLRAEVDGIVKGAGLDPKQMLPIDNTCPDNFEKAGASAAESAKEKLEWKDVFELTEWFRPGTIKRDANFNPNAKTGLRSALVNGSIQPKGRISLGRCHAA